MALFDFYRRVLARLYRYNAVKNIKDEIGVPLRHAIFGKKEFYLALDMVRGFAREKNREIRTVFDIGASVGDKAAVLARTFPSADIFAFEPLPAAYEALKKRMCRFGARTRLYNFGFYNANGTRDLYTEGNPAEDITSTGSSSFLPYNKQFRFDAPKKAGVLKVSVRRLDDFFTESGLERIDFAKIDVESSEKELIEGGKKALACTDTIFMEINPLRRGVRSHDYIDVFEALYKLGFSLVGAYEDFLFTRLLN